MVVKNVKNISGQHEMSKNLVEKQNENFFDVMRLSMADYILNSEKDKNPLWGRRVTGKKTDDTRGVPNIIRYIMGIR